MPEFVRPNSEGVPEIREFREEWSDAARKAAAAARAVRKSGGSLNSAKSAARKAFIATRGGKKLLRDRIPEAVKLGYSGRFDKYFWKEIKRSAPFLNARKAEREKKALNRRGTVVRSYSVPVDRSDRDPLKGAHPRARIRNFTVK